MKKIILISIITVSGSLALHAQQSVSPMPAPNGQKIEVMTSGEANRLNGTAQPTINGMPYSQYKAQQDALKAKQATNNQQAVPSIQVKPVSEDELKNTRQADKPAALKQSASKEAN